MKNSIVILLLTCLIYSCKQNAAEEIKDAGLTLSDTLSEALTPLTLKAPDGTPYVYWIERADEKNMVFFSSSNDNGNTFEKALPIAVTSGCNDGHGQGMPRVIIKKDGAMLVVYHVKEATEDNPYAGKIFYSQSFDKGKTWEAAKILHQDTLRDNSHGFPALTLLPDGEVAAVWLDGRNKLRHSEIFMARTSGKEGFVSESRIGGPACQCCKLDLYTDKDQNVHMLYRGITGDNIRDIMHIASADSGKTFSDPVKISDDGWKIKGCPHAGPGMVGYKDSLHYVWFTMGGGEGIFYCRSDKQGTQFSARENLAKGVGQYPQIASDENNIYIAWQTYDTSRGKDNGYTRVNLQRRSSKGTENRFITPEGKESFHPALLPLQNEAILIAYEQKVNDKKVIRCQKLDLAK